MHNLLRVVVNNMTGKFWMSNTYDETKTYLMIIDSNLV